MKTLAILAALSLSACGSVELQQDSPAPIVDKATMTQEQFAMFSKDEQECRELQKKAMPISFLEAFGSSDVHADEKRREEKAATIMRNCLMNRGHKVIY